MADRTYPSFEDHINEAKGKIGEAIKGIQDFASRPGEDYQAEIREALLKLTEAVMWLEQAKE